MSSISVVILNWNGAHHLRRFLPSVISCSAGAEIVVADNGSTDDSLQLLAEEFTSVRVVRLEKNYGYAGGYNRVLQHIDSDYCVLLNSDVEPAAGWLEPLAALLDSRPEVAAVAPKIKSLEQPDMFEYAGASGGFIDALGYPFCRGRILNTLERDDGQYDDSRDVFWASGAALCCRTEVFRRLGGFAEDFFAHMEEIDLCWRMQLAGYAVAVEPRSVVFHLGAGTLATGHPYKIFLNHRNNLSMLYRCASGPRRVLVAVIRPVTDALAALSYLLGGSPRAAWAVFRAYGDFLRRHGMLRRQRKEIRATAVSEPRKTIYCGLIVLRYICGKRKFANMM